MWSIFTNDAKKKARVLALNSVMPKLLCAVYQQLELPDARSWAAPVRSGSMSWPFPDGKKQPYWATVLQLSWSGRQSRSSYLCPAPPHHHSWYSHNGSPFLSILLKEQEHVCLYLLARGTGVDQIILQQIKRRFLPFYCSMHTCNLTHSIFLIWY